MKRFKPSAETEIKERHFRGLLGGIHVPVCQRIRAKYGRGNDPAYMYVDLHGGPGMLEYNGRHFPGSPLIAHEVLVRSGLPYIAVHYEHNPVVADELRGAVGDRGDVRPEPFEEGTRRSLTGRPVQKYRHGLVYSDPIDTPIPVDTFNLFAEKFPRVDLLAYVAANDQYKRANANGYGHGRRLEDDVRAVNKKTVLIREPHGAHQWTFILWTNWTEIKDWRAQGFHRLDSPAGKRAMDKMNYTAEELHGMVNVPLPFRIPGSAVSDVPRVPETSAVPGGTGAGVQEGTRDV